MRQMTLPGRVRLTAVAKGIGLPAEIPELALLPEEDTYRLQLAELGTAISAAPATIARAKNKARPNRLVTRMNSSNFELSPSHRANQRTLGTVVGQKIALRERRMMSRRATCSRAPFTENFFQAVLVCMWRNSQISRAGTRLIAQKWGQSSHSDFDRQVT